MISLHSSLLLQGYDPWHIPDLKGTLRKEGLSGEPSNHAEKSGHPLHLPEASSCT